MKLTKGHYNRKLLVFGVMIFMAIALISTGFASWVMSNGSEESAEGGVNVGVITNGSVKVSDITFSNDINDFSFEPDANDTEGNIERDPASNSKTECLSVTIVGNVSPVNYIDTVAIQMTVIPEGILKAVDAGYLVLPDCAKAPVVIYENDSIVQNINGLQASTGKTENDVDAVKFAYTITFGWGLKFNYVNPGYYLDDPTAYPVEGKPAESFTYEQKLEEMSKFRKMVYNLPDDTEEDPLTYLPDTHEEKAKMTYKVVVTATAD